MRVDTRILTVTVLFYCCLQGAKSQNTVPKENDSLESYNKHTFSIEEPPFLVRIEQNSCWYQVIRNKKGVLVFSGVKYKEENNQRVHYHPIRANDLLSTHTNQVMAVGEALVKEGDEHETLGKVTFYGMPAKIPETVKPPFLVITKTDRFTWYKVIANEQGQAVISDVLYKQTYDDKILCYKNGTPSGEWTTAKWMKGALKAYELNPKCTNVLLMKLGLSDKIPVIRATGAEINGQQLSDSAFVELKVMPITSWPFLSWVTNTKKWNEGRDAGAVLAVSKIGRAPKIHYLKSIYEYYKLKDPDANDYFCFGEDHQHWYQVYIDYHGKPFFSGLVLEIENGMVSKYSADRFMSKFVDFYDKTNTFFKKVENFKYTVDEFFDGIKNNKKSNLPFCIRPGGKCVPIPAREVPNPGKFGFNLNPGVSWKNIKHIVGKVAEDDKDSNDLKFYEPKNFEFKKASFLVAIGSNVNTLYKVERKKGFWFDSFVVSKEMCKYDGKKVRLHNAGRLEALHTGESSKNKAYSDDPKVPLLSQFTDDADSQLFGRDKPFTEHTYDASHNEASVGESNSWCSNGLTKSLTQ